jgi:uncharacterized protein (TIGR02449 family)
MEELLQCLEKRIKELVEQHHSLKFSNGELCHGKSLLSLRNRALLAKQQQAIARIETLVTKLKTIEKQL